MVGSHLVKFPVTAPETGSPTVKLLHDESRVPQAGSRRHLGCRIQQSW